MIAGRRVGVFAAMSLDGHLAEPNDGLEFLASVQREDEDYGYMAFANRVRGYVVGRRTFDVVTASFGATGEGSSFRRCQTKSTNGRSAWFRHFSVQAFLCFVRAGRRCVSKPWGLLPTIPD